MHRPLGGFKAQGDFAPSISLSAVGRDESGDILIRIEVDNDVSTHVEMTKWHFTQLVSQVFSELQKL